jgi:uncharacterized protein (TIGR00369 family)
MTGNRSAVVVARPDCRALAQILRQIEVPNVEVRVITTNWLSCLRRSRPMAVSSGASQPRAHMIFDEPVRGRVPPSWFWALSGIERVRALYQGLLPLPPVAHLLGVRAAHIGPGSGTWTMPASQSFETETGGLDTAPLQETPLIEVAMTTLPQGMNAVPMTVTVNYFRPPRPQPGNLLARARVVNSSRFFVFSEVEIEDPQGRRIAHGSSHLRLQRIELPSWRRLPSRPTPRRIRTFANRRARCPLSQHGKRMTGTLSCACSPTAHSSRLTSFCCRSNS